MERFDVRFLEGALSDLEEIMLYIAADSKQAAQEQRTLFLAKAADLATFPKRGRYVPDKKIEKLGFRVLVVGNYLMFYKIDGNIVYIHRILHGARNYPLLFKNAIE